MRGGVNPPESPDSPKRLLSQHPSQFGIELLYNTRSYRHISYLSIFLITVVYKDSENKNTTNQIIKIIF